MARDNELYRDKIEVSLDGRQIFSLFFAGAVIVCTVFVIGVVVGKRVEARAHLDRGASAGDPLAALDRLESDAPLSFRRTLQGGEAAAGSVDNEIAAMAVAQQAAQAKGGDEEDDGSTGPKGAKAEAGAAGKEGKDASAKANGKDEEGGADAKAGKSAPKVEADKAKAEAKSDAEAKPEGKAGKLDASAEAAVSKDKAAEKAPDKGDKGDKPEKADKADKADKAKKAKYTLQLSSFQERGEAETFLTEIRAAGYSPTVTQAEVEGKGTFYRVRLGTYPSYDDAVKAKAEFERKVNHIAYVTKI